MDLPSPHSDAVTQNQADIPLADLSGRIERITYTNAESGFSIAKLAVSGRKDLVTIVGNLMAPYPGEVLTLRGEWTRHPKYGEQFKVAQYTTVVPATAYGIKKYLGSGLIKGLGPVMAGRIVKKFGKKTIDIIEGEIHRLAEVAGIGEKRIQMIHQAWIEQKEIRNVMIFLQTHGVGSGYAVKIFKQYGDRAIAVVKENPYRLAGDIFGIGFVTADRIAAKLGMAVNAPRRVEAGILYVLNQLADDGHVYYPYEPLVTRSREILQVNREVVCRSMAALAAERKIVLEDLNENPAEFKENNKAVYLSRFHFCETQIAHSLKRLCRAPKSIRTIDVPKAVAWVQQRIALTLAPNQTAAVERALESKVMVITGGPGTGKTTIINAVIRVVQKLRAAVLLAAPTGRAAKRMAEATGIPAKTIHRLLSFSSAKGGFQKNDENPLECDLLVIDEASMVDTVLMHHLVKAVPQGCTLVLVGDVNQLPSVGAGNVLNDIIASGSVPVVRLNEIFRQARTSRIIVNAHRINQGKLPEPLPPELQGSKSDFYFIQQENPEKILDIIIELTRDRIPRRFGVHPVDDIQVLTSMHRGVIGAGNLNAALQEALNPGQQEIARGGRTFRVNDKVMQIKNNYDKDVFNGDIGKITRIQLENQEITIRFDQRPVVYDLSELDEIVLAYAVSVHKSQGSEYPVVVIPIHTQHYMLLQRNLIYTAVTRGKRLVVMVGTRKALAIGIGNDKTRKRFTYLRYRLEE